MPVITLVLCLKVLGIALTAAGAGVGIDRGIVRPRAEGKAAAAAAAADPDGLTKANPPITKEAVAKDTAARPPFTGPIPATPARHTRFKRATRVRTARGHGVVDNYNPGDTRNLARNRAHFQHKATNWYLALPIVYRYDNAAHIVLVGNKGSGKTLLLNAMTLLSGGDKLNLRHVAAGADGTMTLQGTLGGATEEHIHLFDARGLAIGYDRVEDEVVANVVHTLRTLMAGGVSVGSTLSYSTRGALEGCPAAGTICHRAHQMDAFVWVHKFWDEVSDVPDLADELPLDVKRFADVMNAIHDKLAAGERRANLVLVITHKDIMITKWGEDNFNKFMRLFNVKCKITNAFTHFVDLHSDDEVSNEYPACIDDSTSPAYAKLDTAVAGILRCGLQVSDDTNERRFEDPIGMAKVPPRP